MKGFSPKFLVFVYTLFVAFCTPGVNGLTQDECEKCCSKDYEPDIDASSYCIFGCILKLVYAPEEKTCRELDELTAEAAKQSCTTGENWMKGIDKEEATADGKIRITSCVSGELSHRTVNGFETVEPSGDNNFDVLLIGIAGGCGLVVVGVLLVVVRKRRQSRSNRKKSQLEGEVEGKDKVSLKAQFWEESVDVFESDEEPLEESTYDESVRENADEVDVIISTPPTPPARQHRTSEDSIDDILDSSPKEEETFEVDLSGLGHPVSSSDKLAGFKIDDEI